jgi:hypothetical protein
MGVHCPSTIEIVEDGHNITMLYYKVHVGHEMELKHLSLSQSVKETLASKFINCIICISK